MTPPRLLARFFLITVMAVAVTVAAVPALHSETATATHLQCESMENPLGIDIAHPRFSWWMEGDARGAKQSAYEIQVASSVEALSKSEADVWDSEKIGNSESVNVPYSGPELKSRRRYFWRVRVWDQDGKTSPYSAIQWWEMGLLAREDWKAEWISRNDAVARGDEEAGAKWIWMAKEPAKPVVREHGFRFGFELGETPRAATLLITGKENIATWVNGKIVLRKSGYTPYGTRTPWGRMRVVDVEKELRKGENVIAAEAILDPSDVSDAGLIAVLRVEMADGKIARFVSNEDWRAAQVKGVNNWFAEKFDDSAWPKAAILSEKEQVKLGRPWPAQAANLFRTTFQASKPVRSARIYSTAMGSYQLYLDGQRVGNDILAPGWTDYRKRIVYQVYDVTAQLKEGANALAAILGDGWYASGMTWLQNRYIYGPPPPRLLAQLEIEYADGTRDTVATDGSWKTTAAPIVKSEIYDGEEYDARNEVSGWNQPSSTKGNWEAVRVESAPGVAMVAQDYQPIRAEKVLSAKQVTNPAPGDYVFDLGQNMVGWARLRVAGPRGTKVTLRFAEVLQPNGEVYTDNNRTAEATDSYVLSGDGQEIFEPHFTFHGFRYVELKGFPGEPSRDAVQGVVFHSDIPFTMQFESGNVNVNQLWSNILWGQRGNFLSVPTDCPQRDERLGWTGDAEVFWRTASFNQNLGAFSHKFTADLRDAQTEAGAFTDYAPSSTTGQEGAPGWGDAGIIIPWTAYLQYKDRRILEENWMAMERWMEYIQKANPNYLWRKNRGGDYGDWLAIGSKTPKGLIATAVWANDALLMSQIAQRLNRSADVEKYSQLYKTIRATFRKSFIKTDGTVGNGSQTCYVLALHANLLEENERPAALKKLVDDLKAHDWHLTTGFLGTPNLLAELSRNGRSDVAYRLLLNTTYPSWGYMVTHGATTMWERWNGDQMLKDPGMNSFNHYAYGAVGEWLYRFAAGIDEDPEDPGFHHIVLHPQFNSTIGSVRGAYDSSYGAITSGWKFTSDGITWDVTIPANTRASIYLPADFAGKLSEGGAVLRPGTSATELQAAGKQTVYEIGAGTYHFTLLR